MLKISTIVVMILVLGIIVGGFIYFINLAYRKEKKRRINKVE